MANYEDFTPETREEYLLAKIAGLYEGDLPFTPETREEFLLSKIAESGGGQPPLVLTLVPSGGNPFVGTYTGATPEEVQAAWNSGRVITAVQPTGSEARFLVSDEGFIAGFTMYGVGMSTFVMYILNTVENTYRSIAYSGLTPIGD